MKFTILFMATFWVVLALGLQSLNVNGGYRLLACLTTFIIGGSNLVILKIIPGPTDFWDCIAYLAGGPFGILAAMWLHPRILRWLKRRRPAEADVSTGFAAQITVVLDSRLFDVTNLDQAELTSALAAVLPKRQEGSG